MKRVMSIVCICVVLLAVIAAAVYLIPRQEHIDLTFQGYQIASDGTIVKACSIDLDAVKNDYLLKSDNYKSIDVTVPGYHLDTTYYHGEPIGIMTAPEWTMEYMSFLTFVGENWMPADVYLDFEQKWCGVDFLAPNGEHICFIGTTDSELNPLDIWSEWYYLFS